MTDTCRECGAPVRGAACMDSFHALLALEWEIPGGPGELAHFYAVSSYALQHPVTMRYTDAVARRQREAVRDALEGRVDTEGLRRRARAFAEGPVRVTVHADDPPRPIEISEWPVTVVDALDGGTDGYAERVTRWARSVVDTLDTEERS